MNLARGIQSVRRRLVTVLFDRAGDTTSAVSLDDLGIRKEGYHDYEPSGWRFVERALADLPLGPDDVFVDIGCGKGRVVAQAARRPFRRVLGVELSPELAQQARAVTERQRSRWRCGELEIVVADATTWQVPDDVTVVYVYNALGGAALHALLERVAESAPRAPRQRWFVYANPEGERDLLAHPAFTLDRRLGSDGWSPTDPRRISIFRVD